MAYVTHDFIGAWGSNLHVAGGSPHQVVQVRRGNWRRAYRPWDPPINARIHGETLGMPWYPVFTEVTPWVTVPNIAQIDFQKSTEQRGMKVATITVENVGYVEGEGPGGVYHLIRKGFYSPHLGYVAPTRSDVGHVGNEWFDQLSEQADIRIWQGYGAPLLDEDGNPPFDGGTNGAWVFHGHVDDVDPDSEPAHLTVTARMGKTLTDQRVFGWNISKQLRDPVTFLDRLEADKTKLVGYGARASSNRQYSQAQWVLPDVGGGWASENHTTPDVTEWVQIHVPSGRYSTIKLNCLAGMHAYIGIYPRDIRVRLDDGDYSREFPTKDGSDITSEVWHTEGFGDVPGDNGGWAYCAEIPSTLAGDQEIDLGGEYELGDNSVIRVGFRNLADFGIFSGGVHAYGASVNILGARHRQRDSEIANSQIILVDDVSDIVRVACRWAGLVDWDIEDTGAPLKGRLVINRAEFLIDIIEKAKEVTGFTFFLADPIDGNSFGVPTFRRSGALLREPAALALELRDNETLTGIQTKFTEEPLAYIIRCRGKEATEEQGGYTLGGDRVRRIMAVYRPPWTEDGRAAGIIKHVNNTYDRLTTENDVKMGAYLIAVEEALENGTFVAETAGMPLFELDDQAGLVDEGTGLNSRGLISDISSSFVAGEETTWTTTIQGNLIDSPYLVEIIEQILAENFGSTPVPVQTASRYRRIR